MTLSYTKALTFTTIIFSMAIINLFDSEFIGESDLYFDKLPAKARIYIIVDDLYIRIYRAQDCFYVIEDFNTDTYQDKRYAYYMDNVRRGVPFLSKIHKQWITYALESNLVLYHNAFIRKKFLDNFKI